MRSFAYFTVVWSDRHGWFQTMSFLTKEAASAFMQREVIDRDDLCYERWTDEPDPPEIIEHTMDLDPQTILNALNDAAER